MNKSPTKARYSPHFYLICTRKPTSGTHFGVQTSFVCPRTCRLLTLFLRELIPEQTIVSLKYAPQEHVNPIPDSKGIRVDVECTDTDGTRFVVEMQLAHQKFFYERVNSTFAIQEQMASGEGSFDFPAVYFIGIMDFSLHEDSDQVLYRYQLRERESFELMTDRIQYIFLELTNCHRALTLEATVLENFCYVLHNIENLSGRPDGLENEIFRLLFDSAEIATFTPQEKIKYEYDMTTERDIRNQIAYAEEKGVEKGTEAALQKVGELLRERGMSETEIASLLKAAR